MLCENCHQNEASIHYTEIINGVKKEHHICMDCARRLNFAGMSASRPVRSLTNGMTFDEFTMVGKFGCAECYGVFGPLIEEI